MADENTKSIVPTFIHGIGSSQAIDTAGEIVDLAGIDCSSLIGSAFNFEHKSDLPAQIVGKILEYKKIFSEKDCENDKHKYFWDKCKTPFLYVMGRLFDDKKDSSKEVAALFIDDAEHPNEQPMVGLSIEGSKVDKKGIIVTKSIARKITITNCPANKSCVAEILKTPESKKEENNDSIFKSEATYTIELFEKKEMSVPGIRARSGGIPKFGPIEQKPKPESAQIGTTKSGKPVLSHAKPSEYKNFNAQDHQDAANIHMYHAEKGKGIPGVNHFDISKKHLAHAGRRERQTAQAEAARKEALKRTDLKMNKAMSAGSGMAAPGNLVQGAALAPESMDKKMKKSGRCWTGYEPTPGKKPYSKGSCKPIKKSEALLKAEKEYNNWSKKEDFEKFMSEKMPHLTKSEIKVIGQVFCLHKSMNYEKKILKKMTDQGQNSWINKKEK